MRPANQVFAETGYTPQTYLDRLKRFAEKYYANSDIKQSSPSLVLQLNHIKFDRVPALKQSYGGSKIPNRPKSRCPCSATRRPSGWSQKAEPTTFCGML